MSVNIQLEGKLKKLSGQSITKEKVTTALGYTPASNDDLDVLNTTVDEHIDDTDIHVTEADKNKWNAKSDFSGNYNDLTNLPTDHATITQVDTVATNLSTHTENTDIHLTNDEKTTIGTIRSDGDDKKLEITDEAGNIVFRVDENGVNTTDVKVHGESIVTRIDELDTTIDVLDVAFVEHVQNTDTLHVTDDEKTTLSNISASDSDTELLVTDNNGNIVMKVGETSVNNSSGNPEVGLEITTVVAKKLFVGGEDIVENIDELQQLITGVNGAMHFIDVMDKVPTAENGDDLSVYDNGDVIAVGEEEWVFVNGKFVEFGDITAEGQRITTLENKVNHATTGLDSKASKDELNEVATNLSTHTENGNIHLTNDEKTTIGNISATDSDTELLVTDNNGNVVLKVGETSVVDENNNPEVGLETTNVVAQKVFIGSKDVQTEIDAINTKIGTVPDDYDDVVSMVSDLTDNLDNKIGDVAEGTNVVTMISDLSTEIGDPKTSTKDATGLYALINEKIDEVITDLTTQHNTDLDNLREEIVSESDEWIVADGSGNIIAKVGETSVNGSNGNPEVGLETTTVVAKKVFIDDTNVADTIDELRTEIDTHTEESDNRTDKLHITAAERTAWNAKSDFSGSYNDLTNLPTNHATTSYVDEAITSLTTKHNTDLDNLREEIVSESDEWIVADGSGNIVARVDENGLNTTVVNATTDIQLNGESIIDMIDELDTEIKTRKITATASDDDVVVLSGTGGENSVSYTASHAKSGVTAGTYTNVTVNAYGHVTAGSNPTILQDTTSNVSPSNSNNDTFTAIDSVTRDSNGHVTKVNTKTVNLSTFRDEITEEIVSESTSFTIVDGSGNIGTTIDANGLDTTTVTADTISLNGVDIGNSDTGMMLKSTYDTNHDGIVDKAAKLATARTISLTGDASGSTTFDGSGNVSINVTVANDSHTHSQYLTEHPDVNTTTGNIDTGNTVSPSNSNNDTFTAFDSLTRDNYGHVTKVNTKTVSLSTFRDEITEEIVSGSTSFTIVDGSGNIGTTIDAEGLETTTVTADTVVIDGLTIGPAGTDLGLVKTGGDVTITNGVIAVNDDSHNHSNYAKEVKITGSGNAITAISQSGNTITATKGATFLTKHPDITMGADDNDDIETPSSSNNDRFTAVDSVTRDGNGHVTAVNTKTVDLSTFRDEITEEIVSGSTSFTIVDGSGNIGTTIDSSGLDTTTVTANTIALDGQDLQEKLEDLEVSWNQIQKSGTKIATIKIGDAAATDVYAPSPDGVGGGGDTVNVTQHLTSGTKIATIDVNGTDTDIYAPSPDGVGGGDEVSWSQIQKSGTKIASININGTNTDVYAPTAGESVGDGNTQFTTCVGNVGVTANAATTNGNTYLKLFPDGGVVKSQHKIAGTGGVAVVSDASGNIQISSTIVTQGSGKAVTGVSSENGIITVSKDGNYADIDHVHTLPVASASTFGCVKLSYDAATNTLTISTTESTDPVVSGKTYEAVAM